MRLFRDSALLFIVLTALVSSTILSNQEIPLEELQDRVDKFNSWYKQVNPETKLEARLTENKEIGAFSLEDITSDETYFKLNRDNVISGESIYETPLGALMKELEKTRGYDDYTNIALYVIHEINNPNSKFKAYLDILPRKLNSIAFKYWDDSEKIEKEFENNMPIIRKIVEYKFAVEKKAKIYNAFFFEKNKELFNSDIYNTENIEWVFMLLDARLKIVGNEYLLIPMLDLVTIKENHKNPAKTQKVTLSPENFVESKALSDFPKGTEVYDNLGLSNELYLIHHGVIVEDNFFDCYSFSATFTERREDPLAQKRKAFFEKFFLYDKSHIDLIDECLTQRNAFSRRVLFYFYTCMMDENDLEKIDPKRTNLDEDRLILEYSKERFMSLYDLYPSKYEDDIVRLNEEKNNKLRLSIKYKIEQKKMLLKIIQTYEDELMKLVKEDIL